MYEKFGQFIDGNWSPSSNGETYEVINPATEEVLGKASKASSEDVDRALSQLKKDYKFGKKLHLGKDHIHHKKNCRQDERKTRCAC